MTVNKIPMPKGAIVDNQLRLPGLNPRKNKEFETTDTELNAMARPANSGLSTSPNAINTRAAMGMPITL